MVRVKLPKPVSYCIYTEFLRKFKKKKAYSSSKNVKKVLFDLKSPEQVPICRLFSSPLKESLSKGQKSSGGWIPVREVI
jgi:hypothetical protein